MNTDISGVSSVISGTLSSIVSNIVTVITTLIALFTPFCFVSSSHIARAVRNTANRSTGREDLYSRFSPLKIRSSVKQR